MRLQRQHSSIGSTPSILALELCIEHVGCAGAFLFGPFR
jgi:hypothetical protein